MLRIYQVHTCSYTIATSQMVERPHFMTNHEVGSSLFPLCRFSCIGETGRRLAVVQPRVARHFNLPNHSHYNMTICGLSLHHGNTESRKIHSTNLFTNSCDHISTNGKAPLHSLINHNNPQFLYSL